MHRAPGVPDGGMTLSAAFDRFWKIRNASFLFSTMPDEPVEFDAWWQEHVQRWDATLAEFIKSALKSELVTVFYLDDAGALLQRLNSKSGDRLSQVKAATLTAALKVRATKSAKNCLRLWQSISRRTARMRLRRSMQRARATI
jgi:hypothetical protein